MFTFTQRLRQSAPAIRGMINFEPRIGLDLKLTDIATTVTIMFCLMATGVDTSSAIYSYLSERGSSFDRNTVEFLLNQYDGNDPSSHLWTRHNLGAYSPLSESVGPLWSSDDDDEYYRS